MASASERAKLMWSNPLDPKQDAMQLALLIGVVLCIMLMWKTVIRHILEE